MLEFLYLHPGGQPGQRRGLAHPARAAPGGGEPAVPGGPVRRRRGAEAAGAAPHLRPGGGGRLRGPAGGHQKPLIGSHLRPAGAEPGALAADGGAGGGAGAGAPELLRAEGGGGHPPVGAPGGA